MVLSVEPARRGSEDVVAAVQEGLDAVAALHNVLGPSVTGVAHGVVLHAILTALAQVLALICPRCREGNPL